MFLASFTNLEIKDWQDTNVKKENTEKEITIDTKEIAKNVYGDGHEEYHVRFVHTTYLGNLEISKGISDDPIIFNSLDDVTDYANNINKRASDETYNTFRYSTGGNRFLYSVYEINNPVNTKLDELNSILKNLGVNVFNIYLVFGNSLKKDGIPFKDCNYFYICSRSLSYHLGCFEKESMPRFLNDNWGFNAVYFRKLSDNSELNEFLDKEIIYYKKSLNDKLQKEHNEKLKSTIVQSEIIKLDGTDTQDLINAKLYELEIAPLDEARNEFIDSEIARANKYIQSLEKLKN